MTAPYGPPPAAQRRRRGVVGPLALIFIGSVFLLQNAGYLPPYFWTNMWRLWPLVLVLAGMELLLAHRVPWLALAALAAMVLLLGALATAGRPPIGSTAAPVTRATQTDLGGAAQATVAVRLGTGQLTLGSLTQAADSALARMNFEGLADLAPLASYSVERGTGKLEYQTTAHGPGFMPFVGAAAESRMELSLSPQVPITSLRIETGATDAHLDLTSLHVSNLDMSVGAASTWVRLPEAAGVTSVHIAGGASSITLEIPMGVAAQIRHRGGLSTMNVDQSRFPATAEGAYQSADYAAAANKADINIETGVTSIQVS